MGSSEANSPTPSPNGKRSRDLEEEVYIDNLHNHKRYLSEMMASSLNCLTVGDPIPESILDSPARSENMCYSRDELSMQYSPMSEDLDDARYCETPMSACSSQSESRPTSPVSPYRYKPVGAFCSSPPSTSQPSSGCTAFSGSSQPRQRGSDTEGRFPSSPSDICHSGDLRKAALLRSVQMRAQPSCSSVYDPGFTAIHNVEAETRSCSYLKPLGDEREFHDGCPIMPSSEPEFSQGKDSMGMSLGGFNQEKDSMGMGLGEFNQGKDSMAMSLGELDQGKDSMVMNIGEFDQGKDSMGTNMAEFNQIKDSMGLKMGEFDQRKELMGINMGEFDQRTGSMVMNMGELDQGNDLMLMNMGEFDQGKDSMVMNMGELDQGKGSMGLNLGEYDQGKGSMGLNMGDFDQGKGSMGLNMGDGERSVKCDLDAT